jgi:uncharacterized protein (TIGR02611 family)
VTDNATDVASEEHPAQSGQDSVGEPGRIRRSLHANPVLSLTTKIVVAVVGALVTVVGVVMLVTPGPAFVLIPLGLAILATEFEFARRWLRWARRKAQEAKDKAEALDPAVRRRRLLVTGVAVLLVVAAVTAYVAVYDWPHFAVGGWDWVQSLAGWVPDLPGM